MKTLFRQWLVVLAICLLVSLLVELPYILGYVTAPQNMMYTGLLVNVEDANYLTIIQRGSEGAWLHSLRFTSEPDAPAFLYVFYLAMGHVAALVHLDATTMWHVARVGMTFFTFLVTFGFIGEFLKDSQQRIAAFLLAVLGAGFDWLVFPWESVAPTSAIPVDLKMADAHLFHSALTFPHYLASITCLLILFWCAVRLLNQDLARPEFLGLWILGVSANLGVALVYPFFVILACAVLAAFVLFLMLRARKFLRRQIMIAGALIVPVLPLVGYYASVFASSELLRVWAAQSQTLSPNPLHYVLAFAPYLIFALWGLWHAGMGEDNPVLLWAWVCVVVVLVYAPLGAQRRFLQGVQVPLAILATSGLYEAALPRLRSARWFQSLAARRSYSVDGLQQLAVVMLILLAGLSSAYQWLSAVALTTIVQPYPLFRPRAEVDAMDWLRANARPDEVVLGTYLTSSYLPMRAGTRTFLGHFYETIHFEDKQDLVARFFETQTSEEARGEFLHANGIGYLFYGLAERAAGAYEPAHSSLFERVFDNALVIVYRIKP